jgi:hypothetical protein
VWERKEDEYTDEQSERVRAAGCSQSVVALLDCWTESPMLGWPCLQLGGGVVLATDRLASITKVLLDDGEGQPCNTVSHLSEAQA